MIQKLKDLLRPVFPDFAVRYHARRSLIADRESFLYKSGWMRSVAEGRPCGEDGEPVPWMNFPMVRFLEGRLRKDHHMFEYGCGFSTSFYAKRVAGITAVEHSEAWAALVKETLPDNARLRLRGEDVDGGYASAVEEEGAPYDIVMIDGKDRLNCLRRSLKCLTEAGVVILDDSQRSFYREAFGMAREAGFRELTIEGFKAAMPQWHWTTVFYRDRNCFNL